MTSKRAKQRRDAKIYAAGKYMRWVEDVLKASAGDLQSLEPPVVATWYIGPFTGEPSNFSVWFIFSTRAAQSASVAAATLERARQTAVAALSASGYPAEALATFQFLVTSREEIDDAGGEFAFFR